MARLVEAVLKAQGYTTYLSPPGADKGIDILAAPGPLGFGDPRLCVQVKSGDTPADLPTLNQLIGAMQNVHAQQGLLVSWGGFKASIDREVPAQFFRVRLWDQKSFLDELLAQYDKLDEDLRAELPLKRIWTVAAQDEGE
ncbi:MAG TPA: restriction endonuclease [Gemmataceae bacterium]|nr:restriction endonuclease [Gemmataceae bacterium]